jgi:hypothetical protein
MPEQQTLSPYKEEIALQESNDSNFNSGNGVIIMCINQFFRPKRSIPVENGHGDCYLCKKDDKNCFCTGYREFPVHTFRVV